jgi:NAD-dependent SIR2 family protein deacetylase
MGSGSINHRCNIRILYVAKAPDNGTGARSMVGWQRFARARPNPAHVALARLEAAGFVHQLVTQNVDGLHQRAGSRRVIDLHGRLDAVVCLDCHERWPRTEFQQTLAERNPDFDACSAASAPRWRRPAGSSRFQPVSNSRLPTMRWPIETGGGILRRIGAASPGPAGHGKVGRGPWATGGRFVVDRVLRLPFCRLAATKNIPMAAINLGRTRADNELALKIREPCGEALSKALERLSIR